MLTAQLPRQKIIFASIFAILYKTFLWNAALPLMTRSLGSYFNTSLSNLCSSKGCYHPCILKRSNQFTITKDCGQPKSSMVFTVDAYITSFSSKPAGIPRLLFGETCICKKCVFGQTNASNSCFHVLTEFSIINNIYEADKCVAVSISNSAYYIALLLDGAIFFTRYLLSPKIGVQEALQYKISAKKRRLCGFSSHRIFQCGGAPSCRCSLSNLVSSARWNAAKGRNTKSLVSIGIANFR